MQAHHHSTFRGTAASVQAVAARNLQLLQAIESTLSRLDSDTGLLLAIGRAFEEITNSLTERAQDQPVDPEGAACVALMQASDACSRMYSNAARQHQAACRDRSLREGDGVVEAFEEYLAALRSVHDLVEDVRNWVETHDALLEPATGVVYTNADDLIAALNAA